MIDGPRFFGTDGIRDQVGRGRLAPDNLRRIGRAVGGFAKALAGASPRVVAGRDTRPSGPALLGALAEGLAAEGVAVEDAGVLPTPALAWFAHEEGADLALAVTASHNPPSDNGVKVLVGGDRKSSPEEEEDLEARIRAADPRGAAPRVVPRPEALDRYCEAAVRWLAPEGTLEGVHVVVDCANGATTRTARRVLEALGARVEAPLGSDPLGAINDGCGTEHPEAWRAAVVAARAHGGLAFDGDGDRVLLADEGGAVLDGDALLNLLAGDMLARGELPGRAVVSTFMANLGLERALAARGVRLDRVAVGDRNVAARMRDFGAALGGEQSGHVVLRWGRALVGDGLVAGVRALQAARRLGIALSAARAGVVRVPQVLRNLRLERRVDLDASPAFSAALRSEEQAMAGRGQVYVRWSGTEPLLRIMVQGDDEAAVRGAVARLEAAAGRL